MEAPEELRGPVREGLCKIAARELKAMGQRIDAVFYLLDAMRLFRGKSLQEITFEIGMLGKCGLDVKDPPGEPRPMGAAWEDILGACVPSCIPGFKRIEPGI